MKPDEFFMLMMGMTLGAGLILIGLGTADQSKQLTFDDFKEAKKDAGTSDKSEN